MMIYTYGKKEVGAAYPILKVKTEFFEMQILAERIQLVLVHTYFHSSSHPIKPQTWLTKEGFVNLSAPTLAS